MQKITPFLWFDNQAEEAAKFYTSIFRNSKVGRILRYDEEAAKTSQSGRPVGSVLTIEFEIEGQKFTALNGGPQFKFNGIDLVRCESRDPGRGGLFLGETDCGRRPGISVRLAQGQIRFVVADHSHRFD